MTQDIELTSKEVSLIYYFAVRQIAEIGLEAKAGSLISKKALAIFKGKSIDDYAVIEFIKYYNKRKS